MEVGSMTVVASKKAFPLPFFVGNLLRSFSPVDPSRINGRARVKGWRLRKGFSFTSSSDNHQKVDQSPLRSFVVKLSVNFGCQGATGGRLEIYEVDLISIIHSATFAEPHETNPPPAKVNWCLLACHLSSYSRLTSGHEGAEPRLSFKLCFASFWFISSIPNHLFMFFLTPTLVFGRSLLM